MRLEIERRDRRLMGRVGVFRQIACLADDAKDVEATGHGGLVTAVGGLGRGNQTSSQSEGHDRDESDEGLAHCSLLYSQRHDGRRGTYLRMSRRDGLVS